MKIAAFLATLVVRLIGVNWVWSSLTTAIGVFNTPELMPGIKMPQQPMNDRILLIGALQFGLGIVAVAAAGRIVRLFTADAPLGNE